MNGVLYGGYLRWYFGEIEIGWLDFDKRWEYPWATDAFDWCCYDGMFRLRLVSVINDCADIGLRLFGFGLRLFFGLKVCILGVSIRVSN